MHNVRDKTIHGKTPSDISFLIHSKRESMAVIPALGLAIEAGALATLGSTLATVVHIRAQVDLAAITSDFQFLVAIPEPGISGDPALAFAARGVRVRIRRTLDGNAAVAVLAHPVHAVHEFIRLGLPALGSTFAAVEHVAVLRVHFTAVGGLAVAVLETRWADELALAVLAGAGHGTKNRCAAAVICASICFYSTCKRRSINSIDCTPIRELVQ